MKKQKPFVTLSSLHELPRFRGALDEMWRAGTVPEPATLLGLDGKPSRHIVTMRGGFPNFGRWPFWHHKNFWSAEGGVRGCNIFVADLVASLFVIFVPGTIGLLVGLVPGALIGLAIGVIVKLALRDGHWGGFRLETKDGYLLINYGVPENSWFSSLIRDHILATGDPNVFIGKFHLVIFGRERFLFYFFLSRVKEA
jgi:hypothetical protein